MGLNDVTSAERPHISFFGRRNAGKSSVVNAVTNQKLSIVSDTLGTTTDPVSKAMEILPLGPVVIIDTPGFDDEGELGALRVQRARQVLNKTDIAVLVVDVTAGIGEAENQLLSLFQAKKIPYIIAWNKSDLIPQKEAKTVSAQSGTELYVSALTGENIHALREIIAAIATQNKKEKYIVRDMLSKNDIVILVIPIDESAPKGRIILPQQNVLREGLDANTQVICVQPSELTATLASLKQKPRMVITDSQAFKAVAADTPEDIPLTSFSILLARYKGYLASAVRGVSAIPTLQDGDTILMAESCTHHRQCNDIGTVKIPNMLRKMTGKTLQFRTSSGIEFPEDLSEYKMVIHCGACMTNDREMLYRVKCTEDAGVPITNYGTVIAYFTGILSRALSLFPDLQKFIQ